MDPYILVVDDHPLFRAALGLALGRAAPGVAVTEADSLSAARAALEAKGRPMLALLDLKLPDVDGFGGLIELRDRLGGAPVAIVSGGEAQSVVAMAMSLGAAGFIPKSAGLDVMVEALACLIAGGVWAPSDADDPLDEVGARIAALTHAQQRVLVGLQRGLLNKQIAYDLGVTEATVKAHLTAIFRKLGVQSRTQAVLLAKQRLSGEAEV